MMPRTSLTSFERLSLECSLYQDQCDGSEKTVDAPLDGEPGSSRSRPHWTCEHRGALEHHHSSSVSVAGLVEEHPGQASGSESRPPMEGSMQDLATLQSQKTAGARAFGAW